MADRFRLLVRFMPPTERRAPVPDRLEYSGGIWRLDLQQENIHSSYRIPAREILDTNVVPDRIVCDCTVSCRIKLKKRALKTFLACEVYC